MKSVTQTLLDEALMTPVNDFVDGGGKRIRGALTQVAYEIAGGSGEIPTPISNAIEFLHAGSLVIDDIQDDSCSRRGNPTMHTQVGVPLAINAGNWMYFRALETLAAAPVECGVRLEMTTAMIKASRTCHEGQALDLAARVDQLQPNDFREVATEISKRKTGELVRLAMTLGGLAGGASRSLLAATDRFGIRIGVALQMRNDLDELAALAGSDQEFRDDDLRNARVTWPWTWLANIDASHAKQLSRSPIHSLDQSRSVAQTILARVASVGDAAIGELLDRELRLLGEHVLNLDSFYLLEKSLQPIRFGKNSTQQNQELRDACNR
ncbi:Farnesyl diphosphate synthase [Rubripirellula obstinata]|uniref:Farnesyl diphosphate synthase n=1 Tax=Rubripirellula obstinata TaxID=406547 RepID=A0A5B1CFJ4_9BACT|nr:polyprenyl synthetase family protein [Rubripirellula obstinata]KAA1258685.1 Farnesyl diphosphate synthase [Rubripirellula obstinata]